jgi:hypothetical protein
MDTLLFTERSIWTMLHGIVLSGGALMALAAGLFALGAMRIEQVGTTSPTQIRYLTGLTVSIPVLLWLTVLVGTYVVFPAYRATPPDGLADLSAYPRALLRSNPGTAWLHDFAMEVKEHLPWIAAMLSTAVAFLAMRYRSRLLSDVRLNRMATGLLAVSFILVAFVAVLGVFINKVAPLE